MIANLQAYNKTINLINIKSTQLLKVYLNPLLNQKGQFKVMRTKINKSITKFMNMIINSYETAVYYNVHNFLNVV